jgi:hypothetical protein
MASLKGEVAGAKRRDLAKSENESTGLTNRQICSFYVPREASTVQTIDLSRFF